MRKERCALTQHWASTIPFMKEATILADRGKGPKEITIDPLEFVFSLGPDDTLWIMMGSTNAAVVLGAWRKGATVHQLSPVRMINALNLTSEEGKKTRPTPLIVQRVAISHPEAFYPMYPGQTEILQISSAWQALSDAMEARKAYANLVRSRLQRQAIVSGEINGHLLPNKEELKLLLDDQLATKDENGKKREPKDPFIKGFIRKEDEASQELEKVLRESGLYASVFAPIDGVGPRIAARFIAGIERIERFQKPTDLSNYTGMLPRGKDGKLPSKKRSKGETLSRSPALNTSCYLLQDQMFGWGRKTELGQRLIAQVERDCPCTAEARKIDKELRRKHAKAVTEARIAMTRYFLEKIVWPKWQEYIKR